MNKNIPKQVSSTLIPCLVLGCQTNYKRVENKILKHRMGGELQSLCLFIFLNGAKCNLGKVTSLDVAQG